MAESQAPGADSGKGTTAAREALVVRHWSDQSDRFHAEATLVSRAYNDVKLRKTSNVAIMVPFDRLSTADQQYIRHALPQNATTNSGTNGIGLDEIEAAIKSLAQKPFMSDEIASAKSGMRSLQIQATMPDNMIYVRLSRPFLARLVACEVSQSHPVHDCILGSTVTGASQTHGITELALQPNSRFGELELLFTGTTTYQATADAGVVQVGVTGETIFAASKAVWIDNHGIEIGSAATNTITSSRITDICTSLPGLRGRIAMRIGSRRAAESQAQAQAIAEEHTKHQINDGFDERAQRDVAVLWKQLCSRIAALPANDPLRPRGWRASTTGDALQIVFLGRRGGENVAPPSELDNKADVVVQINAAVLSRAMTDGYLRKLLQPMWFHLAGTSAARANFPQISWSADHCWLAVRWNQFDIPGNENREPHSIVGPTLAPAANRPKLADIVNR